MKNLKICHPVSKWLRRGVILSLLPASLIAGSCGVSTQQEVQLGAEYSSEINRQLPIITDATVQREINLLGNQIARYGKRGLRYTFYVVNSNQVNAFAVPGGYVYINRGLIQQTRNWSELAGVLAHEIGHVEERHSVEQLERQNQANLGLTLAYVLLGRAPSGAERAAIQLGGTAVFARYSRDAENEADRVAIPLLLAAGVNPNGLVTMFELLLAEQRSRPSAVETWFATHPTTEDRIQSTRREISRLTAQQLRGKTTSSANYNTLKSRLRQLPAAKQ